MSCARCWPGKPSAENFNDLFDFQVTSHTDHTGSEAGWVSCRHCGTVYGFSAFDCEYILVPLGRMEFPVSDPDGGTLRQLFERARADGRPWALGIENRMREDYPDAYPFGLQVKARSIPWLSWEPWLPDDLFKRPSEE